MRHNIQYFFFIVTRLFIVTSDTFSCFYKKKKVGAKGPLKPNYGPFLIVCYGECCVLMAKTKKINKINSHGIFLLNTYLQLYIELYGSMMPNYYSLNVTFLPINFIQARQYIQYLFVCSLSLLIPPLCNWFATCRKEIGAKPKYSL